MFKTNAFEKVELGAGVLLNKFTTVDAIDKANDIICATRGGATIAVPATMRNIAVDGVRTNTVESYVNDGWTPTFAFTALTADKESVQMALGVADIEADGKVVPKHDVDTKYFKDYYWYGKRSDGASIVFFLGNAISTGGLSWKTNDKGESESSITLTGNYTAADQDTAPFWMKEIAPAQAPAQAEA